MVGGCFGLVLANLIVLPYHIFASGPLVIAAILNLILGFVFARIFVAYEPQILQAGIVKSATKTTNMVKIIDTNALIDGRIGALVDIHFVEGLIVIPEFVLNELKYLSDHPDEIKRQRGQHGQETAIRLINEYDHVVRYECHGGGDCDLALVDLAQSMNGKIITNDSNLMSLADARGIGCININTLALALQQIYLPGEILSVKIVGSGSHPGQGVAYTEAGTYIIVDGAKDLIGTTTSVVIKKQIQSERGPMIFADVLDQHSPN